MSLLLWVRRDAHIGTRLELDFDSRSLLFRFLQTTYLLISMCRVKQPISYFKPS